MEKRGVRWTDGSCMVGHTGASPSAAQPTTTKTVSAARAVWVHRHRGRKRSHRYARTPLRDLDS